MSTQYPSAPLLTDAQYGKYHKVDNVKSQLYTTIRNTTSNPTNTDKSVKMGSDAYLIEVRRSQREEFGSIITSKGFDGLISNLNEFISKN